MKQLTLAEARALAGAQPAAIADALELPLEDEHGHRHTAVSRLCLALEALREQLAGALAASSGDGDPRIPPWIPLAGTLGEWIPVERELPPPLSYRRVKFKGGAEGSGRMGWANGILVWCDLYIGANPVPTAEVVEWLKPAPKEPA